MIMNTFSLVEQGCKQPPHVNRIRKMVSFELRKEIEISQKIIFTKHDAIYIADPSSMQDTRHI